MNIEICGTVGSGKTSLAKLFTEKDNKVRRKPKWSLKKNYKI